MTTAVLLSGGVDSSVALRLLLESGRDDVTAFYLKIWLEDELAHLGECPWEDDLRHARAVCEQVGVRLEVVPLQREYWQRVVEYVLGELRAGRTPSPDVLCNRRVKFGAFLEAVDGGFDRIASGHYGRVEERDGLCRLLRGVDPIKDQSYFLSHLTQEQLARCEFPIGGLRKARVRELADRWALPNRDRKDSQGICFLGKIPFDDFVRHHLGERPGAILEAGTGRVLGEHRGYWFHTIGQRRGLGLSGGPWYVVAKDVERNEVEVAHAERLPAARRSELEVGSTHWIAGSPRSERLLAKLRHGPGLIGCRVEPLGGDRWRVRLEAPDAGVAPGQFAVLYDGEECLGAGTILG